MRLYVNIRNLEELGENIRTVGNNLRDITDDYRTTNYEILNEIESECTEEIKLSMDEVYNQLDNSFITVKKYESFIVNSYQDYRDTENSIENSTLNLKNNLYSNEKSNSVSFAPIVINTGIGTIIMNFDSDLPAINITYIDTNVKNSGKLLLSDLKTEINNGKNYIEDSFRVIMGLLSQICPGAEFAWTLPVFAGFVTTNGLEGFLDGNTDSKLSQLGEVFGDLEAMAGQIGNAFQTNYRLVSALGLVYILSLIISDNITIGSLSGFETLADITVNSGMISNIGLKDEEETSDTESKTENNESNAIENEIIENEILKEENKTDEDSNLGSEENSEIKNFGEDGDSSNKEENITEDNSEETDSTTEDNSEETDNVTEDNSEEMDSTTEDNSEKTDRSTEDNSKETDNITENNSEGTDSPTKNNSIEIDGTAENNFTEGNEENLKTEPSETEEILRGNEDSTGDIISNKEKAPAENVTPVEEIVPSEETTPVEETVSGEETAPVEENNPSNEDLSGGSDSDDFTDYLGNTDDNNMYQNENSEDSPEISHDENFNVDNNGGGMNDGGLSEGTSSSAFNGGGSINGTGDIENGSVFDTKNLWNSNIPAETAADQDLNNVETEDGKFYDSVSSNAENSYSQTYNKPESFYRRIISSFGNGTAAGGIRRGIINGGAAAGIGAVGVGAAVAGGVGGFGALGGGAAVTGAAGAFGAVSTDMAMGGAMGVLANIIGAGISNVFDLVGNAQMCNLDWLNELTLF